MWRPDGWKELKDKLTDDALAMPQEYFQGLDAGIEVGADAILKALKANQVEIGTVFKEGGTLVVIPDDA